ncbi:hypothetical protein [Curvibacter sp. PAE-UM]|uniref:hypothetical protein n=1 Tax=Curvibacter sp. PAE-UM TaxID=1714344 RepID=UPI0012E34824|nr:hypothetical protein [Curvibacter sp. PAE-UM]
MEYLKWMEQHFELFFVFCFLWVLAWGAFFAWRRHGAGPTHPPFSGSDVRFSEKYVSGSSDKNLFTRVGGARNALVVTVLKDALLVEPVGIFKWLMPPGFNDLEHYVPRSNILRVETASTPSRNRVRIEIRGRDGATRILMLAVRGHEELLSALRS